MNDTTTTTAPEIEVIVATVSAADRVAAIAAAIEAAPSRREATVDHWFTEWFHNIGLDPQLYQRFTAAREDLKRRLKEE